MSSSRTVSLLVYAEVSTKRHCSNDCPFMTLDHYCEAFDTELRWDKAKKEHGYKRPAACKNAEFEGP